MEALSNMFINLYECRSSTISCILTFNYSCMLVHIIFLVYCIPYFYISRIERSVLTGDDATTKRTDGPARQLELRSHICCYKSCETDGGKFRDAARASVFLFATLHGRLETVCLGGKQFVLQDKKKKYAN